MGDSELKLVLILANQIAQGKSVLGNWFLRNQLTDDSVPNMFYYFLHRKIEVLKKIYYPL